MKTVECGLHHYHKNNLFCVLPAGCASSEVVSFNANKKFMENQKEIYVCFVLFHSCLVSAELECLKGKRFSSYFFLQIKGQYRLD